MPAELEERLYGDQGGILFGSDLTWQSVATINYDINRRMQLAAGWRYYKVNTITATFPMTSGRVVRSLLSPQTFEGWSDRGPNS